jgi:hypothetical protein
MSKAVHGQLSKTDANGGTEVLLIGACEWVMPVPLLH